MSEEFVSRLPQYKAKRSESFPKFLIVWCGYEDCVSYGERPFLVAEAEWMRPIKRISRTNQQEFQIVGRSCPYCFRAGRLPDRRALSTKRSGRPSRRTG